MDSPHGLGIGDAIEAGDDQAAGLAESLQLGVDAGQAGGSGQRQALRLGLDQTRPGAVVDLDDVSGGASA